MLPACEKLQVFKRAFVYSVQNRFKWNKIKSRTKKKSCRSVTCWDIIWVLCDSKRNMDMNKPMKSRTMPTTHTVYMELKGSIKKIFVMLGRQLITGYCSTVSHKNNCLYSLSLLLGCSRWVVSSSTFQLNAKDQQRTSCSAGVWLFREVVSRSCCKLQCNHSNEAWISSFVLRWTVAWP